MNKKEAILILIILIGVFYRFHNLNFYMNTDESLLGVSAMKFYHENFEAGRIYVREHPPIGKMAIGLPTLLIRTDYTNLENMAANFYVYDYLAAPLLKQTYIYMRLINAFYGTIALLFIFLISNELKGRLAGLTATAISSVSFNMITYSKLIFMESFFIMTLLGTLYFYVNYSKNKTNKNLLLTLIFFFLCLGSRNMQPLILIPSLLISHYTLSRGKDAFKITLGVIILVIILFAFIYPPSFSESAIQQFSLNSFESVFQLNIIEVIKTLLIKHSLLMTYSTILLTYYLLFTNKKGKLYLNKVKWKNPILLTLLLYLLFFSATIYGSSERYTFLFIPLIGILLSYFTDKIFNNRIISTILITLMVLNIANIVLINGLPSEWYENNDLNALNQLNFPKNLNFGPVEDMFNTMRGLGNPRVITDETNFIIFYNNSILIPPVSSENCNTEYFNQADYLVIEKVNDFLYYFCNEVENYNQVIYQQGFMTILKK